MVLLNILLLALLIFSGMLFLYGLSSLRIVVSTNDVHIVQRQRHTVSYGVGLGAGNVYYAWPAWIPFFGVRVTTLPVSVFDLKLEKYPGYDKGRVPFNIDIIGFFRIVDSNMASARVANLNDLKIQVTGILQGAIRSILASNEIEQILEGRSEFGKQFTEAVDDQLAQWGVHTVKSIEMMDIRDAEDSKVIANIMMKKKSLIESQSRIEVARNMQTAQTAEIEAAQVVSLRKQEAEQVVNIRTAEQQRESEVAKEKASQLVAEQRAITAARNMEVLNVNEVKQAEIKKAVAVVEASQQKEVAVVQAEGNKQQTILVADGQLESKKREAEGNLEVGKAKAESERLLLMAPVSAQLTLAEKIGSNENYQKYLITVRKIEADQVVGIEQARALEKASVKVVANSGQPADGVKSVMDLFSTKGALTLGAALETFSNTDVGAQALALLNKGKPANGAASEH